MGSPQSLLCGERRNRIVIDPWRLRQGETYDASDDDTPPEIISKSIRRSGGELCEAMSEEFKYTVRSVMNDPAGELEPPKRRKTPENALEQAKKWAVEYLKRPHSEKELRQKLAQKGCAEADIEKVTALCVDYGFVNDAEYAGMIARHYGAMGYGPGRVRTELARRGVPKDLWEDALAELGEQTETIDRLLDAKLRGRDIHDRKERDKAAAALFRKGYSWDDIRSALNRYGADTDE